ncbi:MAG: hypothetical protein P8177_03300, partial [Gemmatimonadota bacterium]
MAAVKKALAHAAAAGLRWTCTPNAPDPPEREPMNPEHAAPDLLERLRMHRTLAPMPEEEL